VSQIHNKQAKKEISEAVGLLFEVGVQLASAMDESLAEQGLTRPRAEVIWRLHQLGPMTQRSLSEVLQCTPRNVTGLIDALQADAYVMRDPHPADRRATLLTLTDAGKEVAARWQGAYQELAVRLFADLDGADLTDFVLTLSRILERLGESDLVSQAEPA
jgi:DNA-binding MarR family transcriptional regulator